MMSGFFSKRWLPFLLLALATALVWSQTVAFDFVWDDNFFIRDLPAVRSLTHIPEMFYQIEAQAVRPHDFLVFRPIRTALYAVLCFLGGKAEPQPWIFHLANVFWHGATAMMLYVTAGLLLRRLAKNLSEIEARTWALGIALAFAVHPVVSEVVCWAKSLDDILAAFFTLAALREVLQPPENVAARWRGILFFTLAVYSKESAVPFALILPAIFYKIHGCPLKKTIQRVIPFLLVALIYVVHRHEVIGRTTQTAPISGSYGQTLVDMLPVVLTYFRLLFGVPPFCIDYSYLHGGEVFLSVPVLGGLALLLALVVGAFYAWRSEHWRLAGFGLLWTGLFLLPVSNVLPMMQYLAERFLYLPLIGWLLTVVGVLTMLPRVKMFQVVWFGAILLWAFTAWNRSWIWQDELTLFVRTSRENPRCQRVENNAVAAIFQLPQIKRAYKLENGKLEVLGNIDNGSVEKVVTTFTEGLKLFPDNRNLMGALAMTLATTGHPAEAAPYYGKIAEMDATNAADWLDLARATLASNQLPQSRAALEKVFVLDPNNSFAFSMLFECQWRAEDFSGALETARRWNLAAPDVNSTEALARALKKNNPPGATPAP